MALSIWRTLMGLRRKQRSEGTEDTRKKAGEAISDQDFEKMVTPAARKEAEKKEAEKKEPPKPAERRSPQASAETITSVAEKILEMEKKKNKNK